jgi:hypothetical protein
MIAESIAWQQRGVRNITPPLNQQSRKAKRQLSSVFGCNSENLPATIAFGAAANATIPPPFFCPTLFSRANAFHPVNIEQSQIKNRIFLHIV